MIAPASTRARTALVDGEFLFTREDFRQIATMLHADAGIALVETKATLVYSRLAKRLRLLGLETFQDYCALVSDHGGADERQNMLAALTTNFTRFFREQHHFDHLKTQVMPSLIHRLREGGRARFWSAGCSTGQEAYSMALTVLAAMPDAGGYDIKILATDIDPNVIEAGREGYYTNDNCGPVAPDLLKRWFTRTRQGGWTVGDGLGQLVSFRELHLMNAWPMRGQFDAIFCRNVVIYFEDTTQTTIWNRFIPHLAPQARLYIGHSERISGPALERLTTDGLTTYRLMETRA